MHLNQAPPETGAQDGPELVRIAALRALLARSVPGSTLYLDTETTGLSAERKQAYFDWDARVITGLRGVHPGLKSVFDRIDDTP